MIWTSLWKCQQSLTVRRRKLSLAITGTTFGHQVIQSRYLHSDTSSFSMCYWIYQLHCWSNANTLTLSNRFCYRKQSMFTPLKTIKKVANIHSPRFNSRLFLVPKSSGGWKPVIDLSVLNSFLDIPSFKMETNGVNSEQAENRRKATINDLLSQQYSTY